MASEYPINATLKAGAGFEDPWLTIGGDTVDEVYDKLEEAAARELLGKVASTASLLRAANRVAGTPASDDSERPERPTRPSRPDRSGSSRPSTAPSSSSSRPSRDESAEEHPDGVACDKCGEVVVYKQITSKAGKRFELWTCPNQKSRGDGHHSEFID